MLDLIFLALALSADAFAVSIGLGSRCGKHPTKLALMCALYFGLFQALMPIVGYSSGRGLFRWIEPYAHWIAFILLVFVGGKMVFESFSEGIEEDITKITHRVMLLLAIATSIDAMAAGFAITMMNVTIMFACVVIGTITAIASATGVYIGRGGSLWLESKAELVGGLVLIAIALKLLLL